MRFFKLVFCDVFILLTLFSAHVFGQNNSINPVDVEIGIIEQLDSYIPGDITLITENGDTLQTRDLMGVPTVLSLVYYRCPGICTPKRPKRPITPVLALDRRK